MRFSGWQTAFRFPAVDDLIGYGIIGLRCFTAAVTVLTP